MAVVGSGNIRSGPVGMPQPPLEEDAEDLKEALEDSEDDGGKE